MVTPLAPALLTVEAAAHQLGVHPETVRRAIRSKKLACYRFAGCIRVSPDHLTAYLETHLCPAQGQTVPSSTGAVESGLTGRADWTREEIVGTSAKAVFTGIYFLISDGEVVYVGQSIDVLNRIAQHKAKQIVKFDRFTLIECSRDDLNRLERIYIQRLRPRCNVADPPWDHG